MITLIDVEGNKIEIQSDDKVRCDNCGKPNEEAEGCIAGGYLCDEEWACCEACYDEMVEKGCCFVELGDGHYRQQKY